MFFDVLCENDHDLRGAPFAERRAKLESVLADAAAPLHITPATRDRATASDWFRRFEGAGLDGVMAKPEHGIYEPNRRVMLKVKHERDCDCVVGGFRYAADSTEVGSLLLGLYNHDGLLHHVGFTANIPRNERKTLTTKLQRLAKPPGFTGQAPGGPSRWSTKRSSEWTPLDPQLVVEVSFDHTTGRRFRHGTSFLRWRPDKAPTQCTMKQVQRETVAGMMKLVA